MITTVTLNPALDKTVYIPKLVPNETNRVSKVEIDAGGKGINCSRMLAQLGAETKAIALLGGDTGDFIKMVLGREGIPLEFVPTAKPTRTCIVVQETSDAPPTTLNEHGGPMEHSELVALLEKVKDAARQSSFVVFGGSVPPGVNPDVYNALIQIASHGGAKAILDADGEPFLEGMKAKPFMVKPNRDEAERALGASFESKGDVARAAAQFVDMGIELAAVSLGKQGVIACHEGAIFDAVPPQVNTLSTIGSGDSLIAGILCALERGESVEDALRLGCAAGAATAMSSGVEIGNKADVEALLAQVKVTRVEMAKS